jgi:hypothetical protein
MSEVPSARLDQAGIVGMIIWPRLVAYVAADRATVTDFTTSRREIVRATALGALSEVWPDETTRRLLSDRAVQDSSESVRSRALVELAWQWPDETTRRLLSDRAVQDSGEPVRSRALAELAGQWPDETTRRLLSDRAVQDSGEPVRSSALAELAGQWPDETTRRLLSDRAVQDASESVRSNTLAELARQWPDEATRRLLSDRAVQDSNSDVRSSALVMLAGRWADERTQQLLADRVRVDGYAATSRGRTHSRFGEIVFTRDLDGIGPYLDPAKPLRSEHVARAVEKAGMPKDGIDEATRSLSAHMGWDITAGSGGLPESQPQDVVTSIEGAAEDA